MARLKIGDVIEIKTAKGLAYAQYTHRKERYGALIRILPGFFEKTPESFDELVSHKEKFVTFFPLNAAIRQKIVSIASNEPIPSRAQKFPLFRAGAVNPMTGKVGAWWLWDGEKEWQIDNLTKEQRKLPIRGVWNDTLLIERIENDWTPEKDTRE